MQITIFGVGYLGIVTGACLAEVGHNVLCIDIDQKKIDDLKQGIIPIYEPGLEELVLKNYMEGRIDFSSDAKKGLRFGKAIFSTVGTPSDKYNNYKADLSSVEDVAKIFGENINEYKLFINKSTVPVGTGDLCRNIIFNKIIKRGEKLDFDIVSNPEFLREGTAITDFMFPDRIVIGVESERSKKIMKDIYKPFEINHTNIIYTDIKSAEVIKYASNCFLAMKISFINEIANFAEKVGANITDISNGIGSDDRIGSKFLNAGIGYGGSCLPKDIKAFIEMGKDNGVDFKLIKATQEVNINQKYKVVKKLLNNIPDLRGKIISIWGISYKPKTDDIREALSIDIIKKLINLGVGQIKVFDPVSIDNIKLIFGDNSNIIFADNRYNALVDSNALLLLTEWDEFMRPDFEKMKNLMSGNLIIDGRNIWNKREMLENNFVYECIGN